ncbi:glycosyltransferase family 4 protein [Cochlodiniinecator piscidefendens]|uniref:glycosyltransferase family 4 protein n=1 Tax=Cochlodiniinecator piscidefendens TaxID=2715756 RepID=UPI00140CFE42|nr:glycosyltransferase family 4 protein [Cochlodiniinecator piscidefendens]
MKIAYLCDHSPELDWTYSGGNARIFKALQSEVGDVTVLSNHWGALEWMRRAIHEMPDALNLRLRWRLHLAFSRLIARKVAGELGKERYDMLFCPYSFQSLAGLKLPYPMLRVFTADATPTVYKRSEVGASFGSFLSVSRLFDPLVLRAERKVFQANDLNLWPSHWQKEQADHLYDLQDAQSVVVPWGANMSAPQLGCSRGLDNGVRLLLVGRDWFAKGGLLAFETLNALLSRGVDATLSVVGCTPPDFHRNAAVHVFPSLDKSKPEELKTFENLFQQAHFLLMPSFESYGFAFCEASAYGLPSLCLRQGGIPIVEGVNGFALPSGSTPEMFADQIQSVLSHSEKYEALCRSSRRYYETDLNWKSWAQNLRNLCEGRIVERPLVSPRNE